MKLGLPLRWRRRALLSVWVILLLWLISWAAVPRWVQWQIEKQGLQLLGRVVKVEHVEFRPWSLRLMLRNLQIAKAGAPDALKQPQLKVAEIEVNGALASLFFGAPVADAIVVRQPQLDVTLWGSGQFDIDDVLLRINPPDVASIPIPRLSLFNIQVLGGGVTLHDVSKSITHALTEVQLDVPFLSNIGSRRDVVTHPRLAFRLNGTAFDSDAQTAPFSTDRHAQVRLQVKAMDVAPYRAYWPAVWPVRLAEGQLDLDVSLDFRQKTKPELALSGHVAWSGVKLTEKSGTSAELPWVQMAGLDLKLEEWRPLESVFKLESLRLDRPVVYLRRDRQGELNWTHVLQKFSVEAGVVKPAEKSAAVWQLKHLQMSAGQLHWQDAANTTPVAWVLQDLEFQGRDLSWPAAQPAQIQGQAHIQGGRVAWEGTTDLTSAQLALHWRDLSLKTLAPYWAEWLRPELSGKSTAELKLDWRAATDPQGPRWLITSPRVRVNELVLGRPGQAEVTLAELSLMQMEVDVLRQQLRLGRVVLSRPEMTLSRPAQGRWMFEDWPVKQPSPSPSPSALDPNGSPPWAVTVQQMQIDAGQVHLDDRFAGQRVQLDVRDLNLTAGPWQPLAEVPHTTPLRWSLRTGAARRDGMREPGRADFEGDFRWSFARNARTQSSPFQLKGRLQLARFPVHRLSPYGVEARRFDVKRADLSYAGTVDVALPEEGLGLRVQGQASIENLRSTSLPDGHDLLDIQTLNLQGLDVGVQSGRLKHLKISETVLDDFFARVDIDPAGQLNWQRLFKPLPATGTHAAAEPVHALEPPLLALGPMGLLKGRVLFSDHFIRPSYSADLTELAGRLGAFSNQRMDANTAELADLSVRGVVAGSGSLEVSGRINPLTRPVALDIQGQVRDLELPQLSPYSAKYAGYGIERGKLSAKVNYRIDAAAQLHATHNIVLNQLRFGQRSDSAEAPNLPVKLAATLLADRHGVIDINLPVNGSVNDPDFSLGEIVWKMALNLIGKSILSPFSLMTGAFSSEDTLQQVDFMPGSSALDAAARSKLQVVAKLLIEKPVLHLSLVGHANLDAEREAFRRVKLGGLIQAEKRRRLPRGTGDALGTLVVGADEYPALLQSVYRRSAVPKPRNALGLVKDLPPADMEALLLAAIAVEPSDMLSLAQARAQEVRQALVSSNVPISQLFLGAPLVSAPNPPTAPAPQVTLVVSTD